MLRISLISVLGEFMAQSWVFTKAYYAGWLKETASKRMFCSNYQELLHFLPDVMFFMWIELQCKS